jgi:hypothetical protein
LFCVLYTQCCRCLDCPFLIALRFSLTFVLCIVYPVLSVSGLLILDCPSVFSNLCSVYCIPSVVGVWIVHSWLLLCFYLTFIITSTTAVCITLIPVCFTAYTITAWLRRVMAYRMGYYIKIDVQYMLWFILFPCIPQWYFRYFRYKI